MLAAGDATGGNTRFSRAPATWHSPTSSPVPLMRPLQHGILVEAARSGCLGKCVGHRVHLAAMDEVRRVGGEVVDKASKTFGNPACFNLRDEADPPSRPLQPI